MRQDEIAPGTPPNDRDHAARRSAAQRNLARLTSLAEVSTASRGLIVAAIAGALVGERGLPPEGSRAAVVAKLPGIAMWAWAAAEAPDAVARDLVTARAALGEDARVVLVLRPRARVTSPPLHGEVGAEVEGVDAVPLVLAVGGLEEGQLVRGVDVPWSEGAEAQVTTAGFAAPRARPAT
jgi:hypothetical protein